MSTAYQNLKKHLDLAIRQLKEIKQKSSPFDQEELFSLECQITDLITEISNNQEKTVIKDRDKGGPRGDSESDVEDYV